MDHRESHHNSQFLVLPTKYYFMKPCYKDKTYLFSFNIKEISSFFWRWIFDSNDLWFTDLSLVAIEKKGLILFLKLSMILRICLRLLTDFLKLIWASKLFSFIDFFPAGSSLSLSEDEGINTLLKRLSFFFCWVLFGFISNDDSGVWKIFILMALTLSLPLLPRDW